MRVSPDIEFYIALSIVTLFLTMGLANPEKGKVHKFAYWFASPVLISVLLWAGTNNWIMGFGIGAIFYGYLAANYFRFRT